MNQLADQKIIASGARCSLWKYGQENTIRWIASQLRIPGRKGVLVADEVGMGKTRVVMAAILSVLKSGGTVAAVVPPGLLYQWEKEWDEFIKSLKDKQRYSTIQYSPILLRSYNNLFVDNNLQYPLSENPEKWLLISHQFGRPILRSTSNMRRFSLPILAAAVTIRNRKNGHQNNKFWQALTREGWSHDCLDERCSDCSDYRRKYCLPYLQVKKAAEYLAKKRLGHFRNLVDIREPEDARKYYQSKDGQQMIGDLLGSIDLLVIDEAHKNRGSDSKLQINLENISDSAARRIAMTATPMELKSKQWADLFKRIGEKYPEQIIAAFDAARAEAELHPDNRKMIENLIEQSSRFKKALKPFVTRRLRIKQKDMREILRLKDKEWENNAHPHRDYSQPIEIDFSTIAKTWKPTIFALEAVGKAAKGCITDDSQLNSLLGRLKIADSRYASGQIAGISLDYETVLDQAMKNYIKKYGRDSDLSQRQRNILAKLQRINYWRSRLNSGLRSLHGHPRIQMVADEIERLIQSGPSRQSKVLVFGTFVSPLKVLNKVLNRRGVLVLLNEGRGLPAAKSCVTDLDGIWQEYERKHPPSDAGRRYKDKAELKRAILRAGKTYESLRKGLQRHIDKNFLDTLPGDATLKERGIRGKVLEYLRTRLALAALFSKEDFQNNAHGMQRYAFDIWVKVIENFMDEDDDGKKIKTQWSCPKYLKEKEIDVDRMNNLDRLADNMEKGRIISLIEAELLETNKRFGAFSRLLYGNVKMETRRVLQSQFNSPNSFPQVLIAQSQVGREGLNLHKACKVIVQFHSEWNPSVIEQQIGRVDRIDSYWEGRARTHNKTNPEESVHTAGFPKIDIKPVIFLGTYDHFQHKVSKRRRETLNAHLFGELLSEEALEKMPKDREGAKEWKKLRERLKKAAPEFLPPSTSM